MRETELMYTGKVVSLILQSSNLEKLLCFCAYTTGLDGVHPPALPIAAQDDRGHGECLLWWSC